ncbi:Uncharacterised protein [Mycobacteroides abscessus subsp. abscessus]|nr:Uncharacterised protein [Mycobacteroides abscessus subsp. abscessus]
MRELTEDRFLFVLGRDGTAVGADEIEVRIVDVLHPGHRGEVGQPREHDRGEEPGEDEGVAGVLPARLRERGNRGGHGLDAGERHRTRGEGAEHDEDRRESQARLVGQLVVDDRVVRRLRLRDVALGDHEQADDHREEDGAEEEVGGDREQHGPCP